MALVAQQNGGVQLSRIMDDADFNVLVGHVPYENDGSACDSPSKFSKLLERSRGRRETVIVVDSQHNSHWYAKDLVPALRCDGLALRRNDTNIT